MSFADRLQLRLATGFGVGYLPGPTGTYGSLLCAALYWLVMTAVPVWLQLLMAFLLFAVAVKASHRATEILGHKDPQQVVCDEICGQWIAFLFVPETLKFLVAAFLLFRFFDIVKPFPARRLEHLRAGWGVVADDVMAGLYANATLQLLIHFRVIPWLTR